MGVATQNCLNSAAVGSTEVANNWASDFDTATAIGCGLCDKFAVVSYDACTL